MPLKMARFMNAYLLMVLAGLCFATMEVFVKLLSARMDTVIILWFRNIVQLLIITVIILPRIGSVIRTKYPKLQALRAVLMLSATACFFVGFQRNSLVETNAIAQTAPIWLTLGAALFLGERIGIHRASSVVIGLVGALIVLRPGTPGFSAWLLFPMLGALLYASYAIVTRFVGRGEGIWSSLFYTGLIASVLISLVVPFRWQTPTGLDWAMLCCVGLLGTLAQLCLTSAFARAEASALAPLSYVSLIFSTFWGMTIFGHYPDGITYLGALVIVGAGLYIWQRERAATAA